MTQPIVNTYRIDGIEYSDIVPQNYRMDPETDDVIFGDDLRKGMVVLVEPRNLSRTNDLVVHGSNVLEKNRWCEVQDVRWDPDRGLSFIGQYADGVKIRRSTDVTSGWLVKKDSIPAEEESVMEKATKEGLSIGVWAVLLVLLSMIVYGVFS